MVLKKRDKSDVITYDEFNKIIDHTNFHHDPAPFERIPDDENSYPANETLMGMEYDFDQERDEETDEDAEYERELALERAERDEADEFEEFGDEYSSNPEDFEGDLSADLKQVKRQDIRNHA